MRQINARKKAGQGVEDPDQPGETVAASPVVPLAALGTNPSGHCQRARDNWRKPYLIMTVKLIFMESCHRDEPKNNSG
ncbi:hypothetical protein GCM10007913_33360 [Devosia yakushimensis]|uniref:Uncharacterized protein n=1 Tax=Devosia yakushimensis TaxID=470028 RepID=A0ABQ5UH51_9HYPH|nr:hypothetical protein GCM10007913_33360 [Devosia yakushimensis]